MNNQDSVDRVTPNENRASSNVRGEKNATVTIGGDNRGVISQVNTTKNYHFHIPSVASISLAAISLLADIIALGQLAYNIIVKNEISNLPLQLVAIILVFLLGYGLGIIGLRGFEKTSIYNVLQIYVWGYLILACLSYLGVVSTFRTSYSFNSYIAYVIIIALQLVAFMTLRSVSHVRPEIAHALALMTVSVLHALIFLYQIVYVAVPELNYLIGEWVFWFAWTLYAVPMLRSAFSSGGGGSGSKVPRSKLR